MPRALAALGRVGDDLQLRGDIGGYVDRCVGHEEELVVGGHLHHGDVAGQAPGVDARVFIEGGLQYRRGVDEALHQDVGLPRPHEAHGLRGRGGLVLRLHALEAGEVQPELGGQLLDRRQIADQYRVGEAVHPRVHRRLEGGGILGGGQGYPLSTGFPGCIDHFGDRPHLSYLLGSVV